LPLKLAGIVSTSARTNLAVLVAHSSGIE